MKFFNQKTLYFLYAGNLFHCINSFKTWNPAPVMWYEGWGRVKMFSINSAEQKLWQVSFNAISNETPYKSLLLVLLFFFFAAAAPQRFMNWRAGSVSAWAPLAPDSNDNRDWAKKVEIRHVFARQYVQGDLMRAFLFGSRQMQR